MTFRLFSLLFLCGFSLQLLSPCHAAAQKLKVVTSFSVLQDLTQQIAGAKMEVNTIVGPNSDAHVFQPTPETQKLLAGADLVIINGLEFEGWIKRLIDAAGFKGQVIVASKGITKQYVLDSRVPDPHAWHSVAAVKIYVRNIAQALSLLDPQNKEFYQKRLKHYLEELKELESWVYDSFQSIPAHKRKVVTAHDAFQYYAKEYGLTFLAPQGVSTESEPSAAEVARLIQLIRKESISALFVENMASTRLVEQMAKETGIRVLGPLYSDALSEKTEPAATYINMIRYNTEQLLEAMSNVSQE